MCSNNVFCTTSKGIYMRTAPQKRASDPNSDEDNDNSPRKKSRVSEVWLPDTKLAFQLLLAANFTSALFCHVTDCDETYNYWEPLYHMMYGEGFQTWEYSPAYGIRSWAYICLHYIFTLVHMGLLNANHVFVFYFIRMVLSLACTTCQLVFFEGVVLRFGNNVGRILLCFLILSPGSYISSTSFLPSSFCMYMTCLMMGCWLQGKLNLAILAVAAAAIIGWPFSAALGVPLAVDVLIRRGQYMFFIKWGGIALATMLLPCMIIDSLFYGKLVIAPLNILLYNVFTAHGPDIYGTEPWSYYFLNGFLNFNFVFVLAVLSAFIISICEMSVRYKYKGYRSPSLLYVFTLSPMYLWMCIFFLQPHKEERFLFPIYPLICLSGAVTLATIQKAWCVYKMNRFFKESWLAGVFIVVFSTLALSRSMALYFSYRAPMEIYQPLHRMAAQNDITTAPVRICYGKEWHRFPSSFILPNGFQPRFIESDFRGQLPARFTAKGFNGTKAVPGHFNDANKEEKDRYVDVSTCHFLVDFDSPHPTHYEQRFGEQTEKWKVFFEMDFLDSYESKSRLHRAFYIPFHFWEREYVPQVPAPPFQDQQAEETEEEELMIAIYIELFEFLRLLFLLLLLLLYSLIQMFC